MHSATIRSGFERFAEKLRAGADPDLYSITWEDFPDAPEDVTMRVACSGIRRVDARELPSILASLGNDWDGLIRSLDVPEHVEDSR
jgi:hypothetical protein